MITLIFGGIKDICWKCSKNRAKAHKIQQKLLERELQTLLSFSSTEENIKQISEICKKLGTIHRKQAARVKIRSRTAFIATMKDQLNTFFSFSINSFSILDNPERISLNSLMTKVTYTQAKTRYLIILQSFIPTYTQKNEPKQTRNKSSLIVFTAACPSTSMRRPRAS